MIAVPDLPERPEECPTCKAQTPPKVGYCARRRCYCLHPECPAYATTPEIEQAIEVDPIGLGDDRATGPARRAETAARVASIKADLRARRQEAAAHG